MAIAKLSDFAKSAALVVGASQGVGRGLAQGLSEAGASIALVSRESEIFHFFSQTSTSITPARPARV